jgi:rhodanese-related sulfurtransferase
MSMMDSFENNTSLPFEIDVQSTKSLLDSQESILLLDVREPMEVQACQIEGSTHIPMGEIPMKWEALPKDKRILIYCHHGRRSLMVTHFLRQHGLDNTQSVSGGIMAWSLEIDPTVPRY